MKCAKLDGWDSMEDQFINDSTQQLTDTQRQIAIDWLASKKATFPCSACGQNEWLFSEHLLHGQIFSSGSIRIGGMSYPLAMIICSNCGQVRLHLAVPMNILPPSPK